MAFKLLKKLINKIRRKKDDFNELQEKIEEKIEGQHKEIYATEKPLTQKKFDVALNKSSSNLAQAVELIAKKFYKIDDALYEKIEELLISYDVGVYATDKIIAAIKDEVLKQNIQDGSLIKEIIIDKLFTYYIQNTSVDTILNLQNNQTNVILITGVNGVGKTTTIAKIAHKYIKQNKKVLLVAGDTFRAGAIEQLNLWAQKLKCEIILPIKANADPASVIYQGLQKGYEDKYDLIICDTSGRLHNKVHLMNELAKINKVIKKFDSKAPHESLLVLDATLGQSGVLQAKAFKEITNITGIVLAKMDGTSKGGIILAIKDAFNIPVKFIGLGEKLEDLSAFDLEKFIVGITKQLTLD